MQFSHNEMIEIIEKSSTINERLSSRFIINENPKNARITNLIIEQWCQIAVQGNHEQFEKRLAWDGIDLSKVRAALGYVRMSHTQQLPAWTLTLNECLEAITSVDVDSLQGENSEKNCFLEPEVLVPFKEVLLPFIYVARKRLITLAGFNYKLLSDAAHASIEASLLRWLAHLCAPSLELEFSIFRSTKQSTLIHFLRKSNNDYSRQNYKDFIKGLLEGRVLAFFQEYPVLARLMATLTDFWVDASKEFLWRLASDWSEIQRMFQTETELGQVVAVQTDLSDHHNNGRSVMAIKFASGLKLIYKPKNLSLEQAYFKLLAWLNHQSIPLSFKLLKVINRSTYGWAEFVETSPCKNQEEARLYYQRAGVLLCLVYVLEATDIHQENIIACGEHPVLIDLETLMHPRVQEAENWEHSKKTQYQPYWQFENSVLRTGLLPQWQFGLGSQSYDLSGLGGVSQQNTSFQVPKWLNINTDRMVLISEDAMTQLKANVPCLNGINLSPTHYLEEIVDGFRQMYKFLMEHKKEILSPNSPLTALAKQSVRFVFRSTKIYSSILKKTLNPKFMQDGATRSIQLDILSRAMLGSDSKPLYWSLLSLEKQALEQLDIPLITVRSDSDDLTISPNQTVHRYFTEPSFNCVISRLNQLNEPDLEKQIFFIRGSFHSRMADKVHSCSLSEKSTVSFDTVTLLNREIIVQQAIAIATDLQQRAICSADGSVTWIGPQYILEAQCLQLQPIGSDLYDGSCGLALFLSALEKVASGIGFRDLALGALHSLRQDLQQPSSAYISKAMGIGGATGYGSIIYSLVRISQFLEEPVLLENAKQVASLITPDCIAADKKFDIISGTAGAILGLLALHNSSANQEVLEQAINCGYHLVDNRLASNSKHRAWATLNGKLLTGFSHGAAGIAYALLRLYEITGKPLFLEAAHEAISYERSVFSPEVGNWADFSSPQPEKGFTCKCSWCHGAPGIGLARVAKLDILDTDEIRQDIGVAITTTKQYKQSNMDHLCCGNLGRIEFLFTAARKMFQPQLLEIAITQAAQVVKRAEQQGNFSYNPFLGYTPGFFQGASGIGYELLRLAYPDILPSVLLWE